MEYLNVDDGVNFWEIINIGPNTVEKYLTNLLLTKVFVKLKKGVFKKLRDKENIIRTVRLRASRFFQTIKKTINSRKISYKRPIVYSSDDYNHLSSQEAS